MFPTECSCPCNRPVKMLLIAVAVAFFISGVNSDLVANEEELTILVGKSSYFNLKFTESLVERVSVSVVVQEPGVVSIDPTTIEVPLHATGPWRVNITGVSGGHVLVYANVTPNVTNYDKAFIHVTVQHSDTLAFISVIIGWIYFVAWSVSFYPQIYENFVRKSVIGLNFDFLSLNIVGFILYAAFNCGLYWIPEIEAEYYKRNPRGLNPVQMNDIVFSLHAAFATLLTIAQCFCYERGNQRVSTTARSILAAFFLIFITCLGLVLFNYTTWLDFLYECSYIKLTITLIKYIPQAFMNYQRKSTVGWSIGNVFLDFTGGLLSMGQMIINAYNYNDWASIFGDPTKFGLGLFSVFFDILFIVQHYILYSSARLGEEGKARQHLYVPVYEVEGVSNDVVQTKSDSDEQLEKGNSYELIPGDDSVQAPDTEVSDGRESVSDDDPVGSTPDPEPGPLAPNIVHDVVT